ncbi:response regulator [Vallitalea pronyensis]|uniref:Stage 0 sporulation protein A homolog n=1 Tax=Vallitalea pronyensis TaxID=1348613 RepID=A0A8J8MP33_9FIRM|nr:response regulator [Vallitalea pronyensis]QUI25385.1 response regulator [Vallitalea pronyensis]
MTKERLHVVIVDDEYLIRELLSEKVNWESVGCKLVLKASSALEVYDYMDEHPIDILITDINMPIIDGLAMAKKIKENDSSIKIVVLTGYDDFEYAKTGIDIGIEGYILKPIDYEEIETVVKKMVADIYDELEKKIAYDILLERIENEKAYMRERIFLKLISQKVAIEPINEYGELYDIPVESEHHQIGMIDFFSKNSDNGSKIEAYKSMLKGKIILEEIIGARQESQQVYLFSDVNNMLYIYNANSHFNMVTVLNYYVKVLNQSGIKDMIIGISTMKDNITKLYDAAFEAKQALQMGRIQGNDTIFSMDDMGIMNEVDLDETYFTEELEQLKFYIKAGLVKEAIETVETLFRRISDCIRCMEHQREPFFRFQITRIISNLEFLTLSLDKNIQNCLNESKKFKELHDFGNVYQVVTLSKGESFVKAYVTQMVTAINRYKRNLDTDIIAKVDRYIVEHLSDAELSLKGCAKTFFMNPSYLSRIYKQKKGLSFKEQIIKLRMEKAMERLRNKELKVYEVANEVGIIDPNYFSLCFKKYMKMSVTEYRKNITE